ncbi:MAG TPA: hypothetical protein VMS08_00430, partial [Candidatus Saccharimonadia bacterium]|nr:hypothetical protein [Candidatus Saccharimonadia bacterium]
MRKSGKLVLGAGWLIGFMLLMNRIIAPIGSADPSVRLPAPAVLPASTQAPSPPAQTATEPAKVTTAVDHTVTQ